LCILAKGFPGRILKVSVSHDKGWEKKDELKKFEEEFSV
jgi:hypothetical protein